MVTIEQIKELRDMTGVSVMQCKKALEEAGGDREKAIIILRKKSGEIASKKAERELGSGVIQSYIHMGGSVGAMVELACETDFVAKNEEFKTLAYEIAMQVAATNPKFLKKEDVSEDDKKKATEVFAGEMEGKSEDLKQKIMQGKLDSYFGEKILLEQSFIKNPDITVKGLVESGIQKFGEKIEVVNFVRFSISGK